MSPLFLGLAVLIVVAFTSLAIVSVVQKSSTVSLLTTLAGLPLLAFFCFGFLASFEGNSSEFLWYRGIYVVLFSLVSGAIVTSWWPRTQKLVG